MLLTSSRSSQRGPTYWEATHMVGALPASALSIWAPVPDVHALAERRTLPLLPLRALVPPKP